MSVCLLTLGQVWAQSQTIKGKVLSAADDEPVIGASVSVKGTSKGTITDVDGQFSLEVEPGATLVVRSSVWQVRKLQPPTTWLFLSQRTPSNSMR